LSKEVNKHDIWKQESVWTSIYKFIESKHHDALLKFKDLLIIYRIDTKISIDLIMNYGKNVNKHQLKELLVEIKSSQHKDIIIKRRYKKLKQYNKQIYIIGQAMKYLEDLKDLMNILLLNHAANNILKYKVIKRFISQVKLIQDFPALR